MSADHGGAEIPEAWAQGGVPAARLNPVEAATGLAQELRAKFGIDVTVKLLELDVYLGGKALESGQVDGVAVRRASAAWLSKQPFAVTAVAKDDLDSGPGHRGAGGTAAARLLPDAQRGRALRVEAVPCGE